MRYILDSFSWPVLVIIVLLFVGVFLLSRYVLHSFVTSISTSLSTNERLEILHKEDCLYKRHRFLKDKDIVKGPFIKRGIWDMIFWLERKEFIEAVDVASNQLCYYWIKIERSLFFFPFTTKNITVVKEINVDTILFYKNWTGSAIISVHEKCPACGAVLQLDDVWCSDCDLVFG